MNYKLFAGLQGEDIPFHYVKDNCTEKQALKEALDLGKNIFYEAMRDGKIQSGRNKRVFS